MRENEKERKGLECLTGVDNQKTTLKMVKFPV